MRLKAKKTTSDILPCGKRKPDIGAVLKRSRDLKRFQHLLDKVENAEPLSLSDRLTLSYLLAQKIESLLPIKKDKRKERGKSESAKQRDLDIYVRFKELNSKGGFESAVNMIMQEFSVSRATVTNAKAYGEKWEQTFDKDLQQINMEVQKQMEARRKKRRDITLAALKKPHTAPLV